MNVALLEASHWHVPLYLDPLDATGIEVVAVSDAEQVKGAAVAARFGSTLYSSSNELLDREKVDFAFVFGRHSEMPAFAEALIARKTPAKFLSFSVGRNSRKEPSRCRDVVSVLLPKPRE